MPEVIGASDLHSASANAATDHPGCGLHRMGTQSVLFAPDQLASQLRLHGFMVDESAIQIDRSTANHRERQSARHQRL